MSSIPTNIPPVTISSHNNKNGRRNDARQVKVNQTSNQKKRRNKKDSEFPMGKEVFNDPYSLADEKYRLLVDISVLQNEVEPLRNELDHLKYFIKRTQDSHELKQAEQLQSLDEEYDNLCIKYDNLDNLFSDVVLELNQRHFEIMKQRQKVLMMDLEDAEKALLSLETEFAQPKIAKYEKKYTQNETKIVNLKKLLKELRKEEKELNTRVTNSFSKSSSEDKNAELSRLENNYNSLKVVSLNKKHELEFMQKSFNARAGRIKQVIQAKKNENDEKQERRQFNDKMKKKKEDHFLFDSYMEPDDMQNIREPGELRNNEKKNPRGRNQNARNTNSDSSCSKAKKTQKFILKIDTNMESSDHLDTDNFESFTSPCQSPVSTQNIAQSESENGLSGTKTFGTDDFNSTTEFSNSPRSYNNDDKTNFSKSLQSELGSDEGDLNSTSRLNETEKSTTSALSENYNRKDYNETENETEKQDQSETETEKQSETGTETEKQDQSETEKQSETETEKQSETGTETEKQDQSETEKQSETGTETEKQSETGTETEKQDQSETEKQSETGTETEKQDQSETEAETEKQSETGTETEKQDQSESNGGTHIKNLDQNEIKNDDRKDAKESSNENNDDDIISNSMAETESGVTPPHSPLGQQLNNAVGLLMNQGNK